MVIEVNSLWFFIGLVGSLIGLRLLVELLLVLKQTRRSLMALDETLKVYQDLGTKASETLGEVDVLLEDVQEVGEDYRSVKREMLGLGNQAVEMVSRLVSQVFKS